MPREGVGREHPLNDRTQVVFALTFLVVWGIESFIFHFSKGLSGLIWLLATVPAGIISFIVGAYLVRKSESVVFYQKEAKIIDTSLWLG